MKKGMFIIFCGICCIGLLACNNSISYSNDGEKRSGKDLSRRTIIDSEEYIDFTIRKYDAFTQKRGDVLYALGNKTFKNGTSTLKIDMKEGTIEMVSDSGTYNGRTNLHVYGKFGVEVMAASDDCLYLRRDLQRDGMVLIEENFYKNDQIPDIAVCIPLYGYSKNRIEVSSIMDGYILMPSGTYWRQ